MDKICTSGRGHQGVNRSKKTENSTDTTERKAFRLLAGPHRRGKSQNVYTQEVLKEEAGISDNLLVAARKFQVRSQGHTERSVEYIGDLKRSFKQAYKDEPLTSQVLLQKALTGFHPEIGKQVLLKSGQ